MVCIFGDCELDTHRYTLRRAGHTLQLRPKVFQVLHYLLAHRHQVMSKQELCEQLWPRQFISDATNKLPRSKRRGIKRKKHCLGAKQASGNRTLQGIESTVRAVRQAAGDSQRTQQCIQTLRGHGYQFVAAVTVLPEPFAEHAAQTVAVAAQPPTVLPPLAPPALGDCPSTRPQQEPSPPPLPTALSGMPKAERQQLTVLYCEVVGAPTLIEQLGLDDYHRVWRAYQETCDLVIQRFDGYVAQYLGDRLLGYFGYLQAYDDAAQRAVHAALGLVETRKICNGRLTQEYGIQLAVRIGIHTGLVIMSEVGGRKPSGSLALDKTPQLAAQVQKLAPPGTVVISAATMRLVQGYVVCQELSSPLLSGATSLLPLWHVLRASGARHRLAAAGANRQTPQVRVFQQPAPVYQTLVQTYRQLVQLYAGWEHAPQSKAPASTHDVALYGPCDVTSLPLYCARVELSVYKSQPAIVPQCYQVLAPVVEQGVLFSRG